MAEPDATVMEGRGVMRGAVWGRRVEQGREPWLVSFCLREVCVSVSARGTGSGSEIQREKCLKLAASCERDST